MATATCTRPCWLPSTLQSVGFRFQVSGLMLLRLTAFGNQGEALAFCNACEVLILKMGSQSTWAEHALGVLGNSGSGVSIWGSGFRESLISRSWCVGYVRPAGLACQILAQLRAQSLNENSKTQNSETWIHGS